MYKRYITLETSPIKDEDYQEVDMLHVVARTPSSASDPVIAANATMDC